MKCQCRVSQIFPGNQLLKMDLMLNLAFPGLKRSKAAVLPRFFKIQPSMLGYLFELLSFIKTL